MCRRFESKSPEDLDLEPKEDPIKLETNDVDVVDVIENEKTQLSVRCHSSCWY